MSTWTHEDEDIAEANASRPGGTRMTTRDTWSDQREKLSADPGALYAKSLKTVTQALSGLTQTWIIETWKTDEGFHVSIQVISAEGVASRFMLPPVVAKALFDQPRRLIKKSGKVAGQKAALTAQAKGIRPFETKEDREARQTEEEAATGQWEAEQAQERVHD